MVNQSDRDSADWLNAGSVPAMLKILYEAEKRRNPRLSLASLAEKSGLRSKGYVSDVINGRRPLALNRAVGLGQALGLDGLALKYFVGRVELDSAPSEQARDQIAERLASIAKAMEADIRALPQKLKPSGMSFECFCAIGLFGSSCQRENLVKYFGRDRAFELDAALDELTKLGAIERRGDEIQLSAQQISFSSGSNEDRQALVREGLDEAQRKLARWFGERSEAHFETVVISVQRSQYQKFLNKMRTELETWQSELETENADQIVRLNIQVYPLR